MNVKIVLIIGCYLSCLSLYAKSEISEVKVPSDIKTEQIYLKVVVDKDNQLVVHTSSEIASSQCETDSKKMMISLKDLSSEQIKNLKCKENGSVKKIYHLNDFLNEVSFGKVKKIFIEPMIIPYIHQSTPANKDFAKLIDRFVRKNNLLEKTHIVSKSLRFLRVLKGQVNKDHKIILRLGDNRPDYLHLGLYYNLYGVMPHYQWVYDEDFKKINQNDKRQLRLFLWGDMSPYIKQNLLKKQTNGILITQ
jgi:hypothetical protein